jgi:hypothetical protein
MAECIVRVGPTARNDPDSEVRIVRSTGVGDHEWELVERVFVLGKKKLSFELPEGDYHVMVIGDKLAGVATTAEMEMTFPFNVHLDPPEDHSKDYLRMSLPTDVPVSPSLAQSIKAVLK